MAGDKIPLTELLITLVVPDVTVLITIPIEEYPVAFVFVTPLIIFDDTVAFITSLPVNVAIALLGIKPKAIPNAVPVRAPKFLSIPPILFPEITMPSSNLAYIPPMVTLFGLVPFITF